MTVGQRIKYCREKIGMSQEELALKMGYKDRSSISKIEKSGDENMYLNTIQKISEILGCSPLYLMGWDDKEETKEKLREKHFIEMYSRLASYQKSVVDKLIESLVDDK